MTFQQSTTLGKGVPFPVSHLFSQTKKPQNSWKFKILFDPLNSYAHINNQYNTGIIINVRNPQIKQVLIEEMREEEILQQKVGRIHSNKNTWVGNKKRRIDRLDAFQLAALTRQADGYAPINEKRHRKSVHRN